MANNHSKLINEIACNIGTIGEVNKCKDIFLTEMVKLGIITEEQHLAMSAYFIHLVNSANYGGQFWNLFTKTRQNTSEGSTYYAVARASDIPENVKEIIAILKEQTATVPRMKPQKPKNKAGEKAGKDEKWER